MGLDINGSRFLIYARELGVDFSRTLMIGRQNLFVAPERLAANFAEFGHAVSLDEARRIVSEGKGYAEPFFRALGAAEVSSMDASGFEGATYVHDLNQPIPADLKGRFTAVVDGGSLEHVFNFPVAIKNCMEMVAVGGHYLGITPTSNFSGHGFYQFSPELYFRVLDEPNGFVVQKMVLYHSVRLSPWYEVADPMAVGRRVTFASQTPAYLALMARKTAAADIFRTTPQQSDYSAAWTGKPWKGAQWVPPSKPSRLLSTASDYFGTLSFFLRSRYGQLKSSFRQLDRRRRD